MKGKEGSLLGDKPDFNMAILFLTRLDVRNNDCDLASIEGDVFRIYRTLKSIYLMIKYRVKKFPSKKLFGGKDYESTKKDIETYFDDIFKILSNRDSASMNKIKVENDLEKIRESLYDLLWSEHMIFPEKFSMTFDKEVEGDFK